MNTKLAHFLSVYRTDGTLWDRMFRIHFCRCAMNSACTIEDWERGKKSELQSVYSKSIHMTTKLAHFPLRKTVGIEFSE